MTNKSLTLILSLVLLLSASGAVLAEDSHDSDHNFRSVTSQTTDQDDHPATASAVTNVNGNHFVVSGTITALSGNFLVVNGKTIYLDPSKVKQIVENGMLKVGERVHAEGIVVNGLLYAREVNIQQPDQDESAKTATGSAQFHAIIRLNSSTSSANLATGSATATGSASPTLELVVKAQGTVTQVVTALQQLLNSLLSIFH